MKLRLATDDDLAFLHRLRNDEETRRMSRTQHEISYDEHQEWFHRTRDTVYVAEHDGERVGVIRLVRHPHEMEMGLIVAPEARGKGFAAEMIRLGAIKAAAPVVAYVRADNVKSLKAFERAGFHREEEYVRFSS